MKTTGQFTVTLPVPQAETGEEETLELVFQWKVQAVPPMSADERIQQEIFWARQALDHAQRASLNEPSFSLQDVDQLGFALAHAVRAWDQTHLEGNRSGYFEHFNAFFDAAPKPLQRIVLKAQSALIQLQHLQTGTPSEAVEAVRTAVEAVLGTICLNSSEPPSPEKCS